MPRFKEMPMHPSQVLLFSQSVEDALPNDSDVRGFNDVMECLDYSDIYSKCSERGCPPYPPKVMVKILTYAYAKGTRSSRAIEEMLKVDVRFIWLAGGLRPDHNTLARFRKDNWEFLGSLFRDSVRVCAEAGLVSLNIVAVDGTKIESRASKRKVYSQRKLDRQLAAVERILAEAEEVDRAEDEIYKEGSCDQLPEHLRDAKERKAKLEQIAKRLKESRKKNVIETDPDSRVMMTGDGLHPCYNLQTAVDSDNQVIVAAELIQEEDDHGELPGMVRDIEENLGMSPDVTIADCGYVDEATLLWVEDTERDVLMPVQEHPKDADMNNLFASRCFLREEGRDVLLCPAGRELTYKGESRSGSGTYRRYAAKGCQSCTFYRQCVPKGRRSRTVSISIAAKARRKMRDRLRSEEGKKLYDKRQEIVEPVFGQKKTNQGFDRFLLWGLKGAKAESALMFLAHNVMKCAAKAAFWAQLPAFCVVRLCGSIFSRWRRPGNNYAACGHGF